ncbi:MAG: acetyl-CoA carboxylase biotin carboxyl carrier protein [Candidatus Neomarinimicrobiota bacterium]
MWQDKVKEVIDILENSNVNEIEVTFWGRKIRAVKNASNVISSTSSSPDLNKIKSINVEEKNNKTSTIDDAGEKVLSPMPGVFYSAQSPDKPPFVSEGDQVKTGQTLCIIESMKIMNEIESEQSGIIKKILVNNSDPVEFNQPLFIIE